MKKRLISFILTVSLLFSLAPCAFAANKEKTLTNVAQVVKFGMRENGSMTISKATLHRGGEAQEIYLIGLGGAHLNPFKCNDYVSHVLSIFSFGSSYLFAVMKAAREYIPEGSKIVLVGHSVGGTIAQQFAADIVMKSRYEILDVIACGSPILVLFGREGELHRLADVTDPVPYLSAALIFNFFLDISLENGGYFGTLNNSHAECYLREDVWGDYDALGVKGGDAYITCKSGDSIGISTSIFGLLK